MSHFHDCLKCGHEDQCDYEGWWQEFCPALDDDNRPWCLDCQADAQWFLGLL